MFSLLNDGQAPSGPDEVDPVSEAVVYATYGLGEQALALLLRAEAKETDPEAKARLELAAENLRAGRPVDAGLDDRQEGFARSLIEPKVASEATDAAALAAAVQALCPASRVVVATLVQHLSRLERADYYRAVVNAKIEG